MISLIVAGLLLVAVSANVNVAQADDGYSSCASCESCGCQGGKCGGGLFHHAQFVPAVTYYAPYPYWFPQYFGPPHTDYLVVQYVTPPAESAMIVKERILAINSANPALLPLSNEPLPYPKPNGVEVPKNGKNAPKE